MSTESNARLTSPETLAEVGGEATIEVLETMFFELPEAPPERQDAPPEDSVIALAEFSGDLAGVVETAMSPWVARRLTASFLGREDETTVTEAETRQVVCEFTNMVCGNALSRLEPDGKLRISTPEIGRQGAPGGEWLLFPLESGLLGLKLTIKEGV